MKTTLKGKKKVFCEEYVKDTNATQAAIRTGYSKNTASSQGSRLLRDAKVKEYVNFLKKEAFKRNQCDVDELVSMLSQMSTWRVSDLYDKDGNIKKLTEWPEGAKLSLVTVPTSTDVESIEEKSVKFVDRKGVIIELMKYNGAYRKDNEQKTPNADQIAIFKLPDNKR